MEIIKIRAKFSKEINEALLAELGKGIPEEARDAIHRMTKLFAGINDRAYEAQAIPIKDVEEFNKLCYQFFPKQQDGGEFTKEEAPKDKPRKGNKITYAERKAVYEQAIEKYGIKPQLLMVIEEMSELTKALCKYFRDENIDLTQIADETADVTIMLEQLRLIFDLNDEVCEHMDMKVNRLAGRLGMF